MSDKRLLVQKCHLHEVLDMSESTVKNLINQGLFPPPAGKIGNRFVWSISDLNLWIDLELPGEKVFVERKKDLTINRE